MNSHDLCRDDIPARNLNVTSEEPYGDVEEMDSMWEFLFLFSCVHAFSLSDTSINHDFVVNEKKKVRRTLQ